MLYNIHNKDVILSKDFMNTLLVNWVLLSAFVLILVLFLDPRN